LNLKIRNGRHLNLEMAEKKEALSQEIEALRAQREKEKNDYEEEIKERDMRKKRGAIEKRKITSILLRENKS
jgi:hypothetical protein